MLVAGPCGHGKQVARCGKSSLKMLLERSESNGIS
jgi:hypothetical protein